MSEWIDKEFEFTNKEGLPIKKTEWKELSSNGITYRVYPEGHSYVVKENSSTLMTVSPQKERMIYIENLVSR